MDFGDIHSDGPLRLRNSDLVVNKVYSFLREMETMENYSQTTNLYKAVTLGEWLSDGRVKHNKNAIWSLDVRLLQNLSVQNITYVVKKPSATIKWYDKGEHSIKTD